LQEEGVILSRHGIGTFVRSKNSLVRNPLEINYGVTEIIESMGLRAGTAEIKAQRTEADRAISEKLKIDVGSSIVVIQRVRTANEKPVVYTLDIIPEATLGKIDLPMKFNESLYKLLEEKYNQKVDYGIARIIPTLAGAEVSKRLKIRVRLVVLLIEQVDYNMENRPILYSQEYWLTDVFEFTIFRRHR
jgi:GntR family transcriptional regulator